MTKRNITEEVQQRMQEMISKKQSDLEEIRKKQATVKAQLNTANLAIKDATESMDIDAYERATAAKGKAQTALDMYNGRYLQLQKQEYISEVESDKVIDSLKAYEDQLAEDFRKDIAPLLKKLAVLHTTYIQAVKETEGTMQEWTSAIHYNYRTEGALYANGTNRNDKPQPVRLTPYNGCGEAETLGKYLDKAKALYQ